MSESEIQAALAGGADPNARGVVEAHTGRETTALHQAIKMVTTRAAELLVAAGADVNAIDGDGKRPIDLALGCKPLTQRPMVELLLAAKADTAHLTRSSVPKPLHGLFPGLKAQKKLTLDDVKNPHAEAAGIAGWTAGIEGYLDDVLHLDPDRKPSSYRIEPLWTDYIESDDYVVTEYASLGAAAQKQLKSIFADVFARLAK